MTRAPYPVVIPGAPRGLASTVPSVASIGAVRRRLTPAMITPTLSGISDVRHIALTYDDGPDPASTPYFLDALDHYQVRATFFVIGKHVTDGGLLREMVARGHEIGVHGWDHLPTITRSRHRLGIEIARTCGLLQDLTGSPVRWYRPPYGWVTRHTLACADSAGLRLVLWSAWGRDWRRRATADSVEATVLAQAHPGGTVLLHDSDRMSSPGSWIGTLTATHRLLGRWAAQGIAVGPLADHWSHRPRPERQAGSSGRPVAQ